MVETTLYRGVRANHSRIEHARGGRALPLNPDGKQDSDLHNAGETDSPFTSWTTDPYVALGYAEQDGPGGIVLVDRIDLDAEVDDGRACYPPIDRFNESEVLRLGIIEDLDVFEVDDFRDGQWEGA